MTIKILVNMKVEISCSNLFCMFDRTYEKWVKKIKPLRVT